MFASYWQIVSLSFSVGNESCRLQIIAGTSNLEWMNDWMMHLYSAFLCIAVHPKRYTIKWGVSPQPPPVCSIHLDDATAATGQWRQCAHHTPATGGEERVIGQSSGNLVPTFMPVGSDKCLSLNKLNNSFNWFIEKKLNHSRRIQATVFISESFNHSFNQFIQNTDSFWDKIPLLFMMQWVYYSFVSNYCCWWSKNILSKGVFTPGLVWAFVSEPGKFLPWFNSFWHIWTQQSHSDSNQNWPKIAWMR